MDSVVCEIRDIPFFNTNNGTQADTREISSKTQAPETTPSVTDTNKLNIANLPVVTKPHKYFKY